MLTSESANKSFASYVFLSLKRICWSGAKEKKENTLVSGNVGDIKNLHPSGRKFIFLNRFSGDILFSFLVFFVFLIIVFVCLFVRCFLKLKMYILIYIWPCGRVSDKKSFNKPISGNKTTFFGLGCASNASSEKSVVNLYTKRSVFFPLNSRHMPKRFLACI